MNFYLNPDGLALKQKLLASYMPINSEPFQRTDIRMQPLGPAPNY
jgi:hypothetical protein